MPRLSRNEREKPKEMLQGASVSLLYSKESHRNFAKVFMKVEGIQTIRGHEVTQVSQPIEKIGIFNTFSFKEPISDGDVINCTST